MLRIAISPAAYAAIAATMPGSVGAEPERAPSGDYRNWLDPGVVNRLKTMRGPRESYSDVIVRLVELATFRPTQGG
jgi:hypothetical protein